MVTLNKTKLACLFVILLFPKANSHSETNKTPVKQRTIDGGVSIATGLMFADLTEVSVDEVRALLLSLRPHFGMLLHLAVNIPFNQVQVGQHLLHLE